MAGLLDQFFGNADQTQALGLLGAQMMRGRTADGLMMANQFMGQAPQRQLQTQLQQAQLAETLAQAEERKMRIAQAERQQEMMNRLLFPQGAPQAPQGPQGLPSGPAPQGAPSGMGMPQPQGASSGGILGLSQQLGIPVEAIQADIAFNGGKKISELLAERSKPNWQNVNGNLVNTNAPGFQGGFQPGINVSRDGQATMWQPDGRGGVVVGAPQGAFETYGRYQDIGEGARARHDPVQVVQQDGSTRFVPRSEVVRPQPPAGSNADADRFAILSQELQRAKAAGNMMDVAAIESEIRRLPNSARTAASPSGLAVQGGYQATPSTSQKLSAEAGGRINDSWLKTSYEPTLAAGGTARDLLETVQVTRQAMQNLGGTGWSTQAKAAGAAVLTGLGIAPKNAETFAANAELFQKTAMERLWTTLNEAKGPQTEGDAERAGKTYASLKNTTKANEFILDFAEAKAQRDQIKARFYQQALPIAQQKGDLSEVDREWSKLAPSIFSMPSLKRWQGGIQ